MADERPDDDLDALVEIDAANNAWLASHPLWAVDSNGVHHWGEGEPFRTNCSVLLERPRLVWAREECWDRWPGEDDLCPACRAIAERRGAGPGGAQRRRTR